MFSRFKNIFIIAFGTFIHSALAGTVTVSWDAVTTDISGAAETGTIYYQVYGNTFPAFPISAANFLGATTNTSLTYTDARIVDSGSHFFFRIIATDEWGNSSEATNVVGTTTFVLARVKVFLEGAYDAAGDSMRTTLRQNDLIPLSSPYTLAPRTINEMPADIVDWIYVGLRSEAAGATIAEGSYLLKKDGTIVEEDGTTAEIGVLGVTENRYFLIVRHRNHIGVMSSIDMALEINSSFQFDFAIDKNKYYGNDARELEVGQFGLYAGDANNSEFITYADKDPINSNINTSNYNIADINLSGLVTFADKDHINSNVNTSCNVP